MENIFSQVQHLAEEVKEYVNVQVDLAKIKVAEKASKIVANTVASIVAAIVFIFFLFFASMGLALFLSSLIGKSYAGFLIVAGLYLVVGLVIWYSRTKWIQVPVMNAIIRQIFSEEEEHGKN